MLVRVNSERLLKVSKERMRILMKHYRKTAEFKRKAAQLEYQNEGIERVMETCFQSLEYIFSLTLKLLIFFECLMTTKNNVRMKENMLKQKKQNENMKNLS
jgi:hypothetical protein